MSISVQGGGNISEKEDVKMNFIVISSNVNNSPSTHNDWKNYIKKTGLVFMGWDVDHDLGKQFSKIVKGDLVLVAHGSSKNKKLIIAGYVASKIMRDKLEDAPNKDYSMYCRLSPYIELDEHPQKYNISFKGAAYGDAQRVPAIYYLYPNKNTTDKTIVEKLVFLLEKIKREAKMKNLISIIESNKQVILTGPPGTGKTYTAKQLVEEMLGVDKVKFPDENERGSYAIVQFHPSYSYEDFVQGIVAETKGVQVTYQVKDKILVEMAKEATKKENKDKKYILIIDEINRANLPSVLGELIYAIEYRGEPVDLLYGKDREQDNTSEYSKTISIPENLYIIGTMNTADRSIGHIDYAIRRRFIFFPLKPDEIHITNPFAKRLFEKVSALFITKEQGRSEYLSTDFDPDDVRIGHSYFMINKNEKDKGNESEILAGKFAFQVLPLLKEYHKDEVLKKFQLDIEVTTIDIEEINYLDIFEKLKNNFSTQSQQLETEATEENENGAD